MISLESFDKANPVVAEAVRVLNAMTPTSKITYLTYRDWVKGTRKISTAYSILLVMKGVRP